MITFLQAHFITMHTMFWQIHFGFWYLRSLLSGVGRKFLRLCRAKARRRTRLGDVDCKRISLFSTCGPSLNNLGIPVKERWNFQSSMNNFNWFLIDYKHDQSSWNSASICFMLWNCVKFDMGKLSLFFLAKHSMLCSLIFFLVFLSC